MVRENMRSPRAVFQHLYFVRTTLQGGFLLGFDSRPRTDPQRCHSTFLSPFTKENRFISVRRAPQSFEPPPLRRDLRKRDTLGLRRSGSTPDLRRVRPHYVDSTASRPICEVKLRQAGLVVWFVRTCEVLVLYFNFHSCGLAYFRVGWWSGFGTWSCGGAVDFRAGWLRTAKASASTSGWVRALETCADSTAMRT